MPSFRVLAQSNDDEFIRTDPLVGTVPPQDWDAVHFAFVTALEVASGWSADGVPCRIEDSRGNVWWPIECYRERKRARK